MYLWGFDPQSRIRNWKSYNNKKRLGSEWISIWLRIPYTCSHNVSVQVGVLRGGGGVVDPTSLWSVGCPRCPWRGHWDEVGWILQEGGTEHLRQVARIRRRDRVTAWGQYNSHCSGSGIRRICYFLGLQGYKSVRDTNPFLFVRIWILQFLTKQLRKDLIFYFCTFLIT